jgi:hypothetical protein
VLYGAPGAVPAVQDLVTIVRLKVQAV